MKEHKNFNGFIIENNTRHKNSQGSNFKTIALNFSNMSLSLIVKLILPNLLCSLKCLLQNQR